MRRAAITFLHPIENIREISCLYMTLSKILYAGVFLSSMNRIMRKTIVCIKKIKLKAVLREHNSDCPNCDRENLNVQLLIFSKFNPKCFLEESKCFFCQNSYMHYLMTCTAY